MSSTLIELDQLFRALHRSRGQQRLVAFKKFCLAVIAAQRRDELGTS